MDQRRNRCRAGHGVGHPYVERDLRRLAARTQKKQQTDRSHDARSRAFDRRLRHDREIGGAEPGEHHEHRDEKSEVTDAIDDERFFSRGSRELFVVIEADQ